MNNFKVLMNGIVKENPTFVLLLGMCPTLGTTSSAINGMGMGLATMFVLICSNVVISSIKNLIPDMVRIPAFIVVIASFVTLLQMIMQAYVPALYATLGLFIPLIVVNCILLGRAEAFAAKNGPVPSFFDGLGMGLGFTLALTILGGVREFLGTGKLFDIAIMPEQYGMLIFVLAPGAFIALGYLIAIVNKLKKAWVFVHSSVYPRKLRQLRVWERLLHSCLPSLPLLPILSRNSCSMLSGWNICRPLHLSLSLQHWYRWWKSF